MPVYEFICKGCESRFDKVLPIPARKDPQSCPDCGCGDTEKIMSQVGFVLRGDDWPGKSMRVNRQMAARRERVAPRQEALKRDAPGVRLVPNVDGERTDSWSDAKKLAASKGKDTTTYDPLIRSEKK